MIRKATVLTIYTKISIIRLASSEVIIIINNSILSLVPPIHKYFRINSANWDKKFFMEVITHHKAVFYVPISVSELGTGEEVSALDFWSR